jgi:hypothetical protein
MKLKTLLFTSLFGLGSLGSANAGTKTLYSLVTETNEAGGSFQVTKATMTSSETDADGKITVVRKTEVKVPNGSGGFTEKETQETTVATPTTAEGVTTFSVQTTTVEVVTALDADKVATADPVTGDAVLGNIEEVAEGQIEDFLPTVGTFEDPDPQFEEPPEISAA